ncbi:hypothetical protein SASPL_148844 [Salvia splendens]|uniref:Uncharacterized protein n=1 Tax=Salvia splendens TaxID=180675 RepID=A0A8X8W9T3_SALSN|nr:hypothetical protein SASPL_148844 [Salvia splendens]
MSLCHCETAAREIAATIKICDCDCGCCIDQLYSAIAEKPNWLNLKDLDEKNQFIQTPLHDAAAAGKTTLVVEIMNLMPVLGQKLNMEGLSPLHLAVEKGKADTTLALASLDKQLVSVKGKGGLTPLHYAAALAKPSDANAVAATHSPLQPELDPPDQPWMYTDAQPPHAPYTYTNSYALLRSPYAGPQNLSLPPYKLDRHQLHHDHQPIAYQQPPLTAAAAANLPHQNYQPVGQQCCTGKPPLGWPQPTPQHSSSCWCPPIATPLPTAAVPISTPTNGFVEIQHLSHLPRHAQFQIFAEPISDSSDVEMLIMEEVRTEELPPIESAVHVALENGNDEAALYLVNWLIIVAKESLLSNGDVHGNTTLHVAARYCTNMTPLDVAIHHNNGDAKNVLIQAGVPRHGHPSPPRKQTIVDGSLPPQTIRGRMARDANPRLLLHHQGAHHGHAQHHPRRRRPHRHRHLPGCPATPWRGLLRRGAPERLALVRCVLADKQHPPGRMVMGTIKYSYFMPTNTLAFISSTLIIIFVLPDRAFIMILQACLIFMCVSYLLALNFISYYNSFSKILDIVCGCTLGVAFLLKLGYYFVMAYYNDDEWLLRRLGVIINNRRAWVQGKSKKDELEKDVDFGEDEAAVPTS